MKGERKTTVPDTTPSLEKRIRDKVLLQLVLDNKMTVEQAEEQEKTRDCIGDLNIAIRNATNRYKLLRRLRERVAFIDTELLGDEQMKKLFPTA